MQNPVERWFADAFRLAHGFTSAGSKGKGFLLWVLLSTSRVPPCFPAVLFFLQDSHVPSEVVIFPPNVLPKALKRHPTSSKRPPNVIRRPPASSKRPPNGLQTAPERFPTFSRVFLTFSRVLRFPPSHFLHPIHPVSLSLHPLSCIHTENPATTVSPNHCFTNSVLFPNHCFTSPLLFTPLLP